MASATLRTVEGGGSDISSVTAEKVESAARILQLTTKLNICRVWRMKLRISSQTLRVLDVFFEQPEDWKYGYDLSRNTGLKSGTLYPILMRLADHKLLETRWEQSEPGRPPRHMYRFTPEGLRYTKAQSKARSAVRLSEAASALGKA